VNLDVIYGEPDDGSLDPAQVAALIKVDTEPRTPATPMPDVTANGSHQASVPAPAGWGARLGRCL